MSGLSWQEDARYAWDILSWQGEAQWFARKDSKVLGGRLRSESELVATIRNAEVLKWNLYLNANPTRHVPGKKKLSREDVTHWRYVVVDLDPAGEALAPPSPGSGDHALLTKAVRLFSGRGYQFWLPLRIMEIGHLASTCTAQVEPLNTAAAERVMQGYLRTLSSQTDGWCPGWKVDTTCSDLARVVRCPGSVNQRTGRRATLEEYPYGMPLIEPSVIAKYADVVTLPPEPLPKGEFKNLLDLLPHLNVRARTFILEGAESPGRHKACYATCKNMQELGVPAEEAEEWLTYGARTCWRGWNVREPNLAYASDPLSSSEVERIVKQVYSKE